MPEIAVPVLLLLLSNCIVKKADVLRHNTIDSVIRHAKKGHQVMMGYGHTGDVKIKVKYGPFGFFTTRYQTDRTEFEEIKKRLKLLNKSKT